MRYPKYYILVGRAPIAVNTSMWVKFIEGRRDDKDGDWRVGLDHINDKCHVSTVFLGIDHNFSREGDPILFETLVFGGPLDGEMTRYCTYAEAEKGHAEMVSQARIACAQVKAIADNAGAKV